MSHRAREGRIFLSTHNLEVAGRLRSALEDAKYAVELVTPDEELSAEDPPQVMFLTGGLESGAAAALVRQAHEVLSVPVFGMLSAEAPPAASRYPGLDEVFPSGTSAAEVVVVIRTLTERLRLQELTGIVGESDAIREALERVVQIAPVDSTVLVMGESGTGKELVARGVHALSKRRHKPFIAVNVAALSETLLESEIFGHEKGAFTGAIALRRGLFELAHEGTIFLDEIGEMPLITQTKLLRILEQREFLRVGGEETIRVDVRIVAATNQDLLQLVATGRFRKDLYYRLNVLRIDLPPLRSRRDDIPLLIDAFIRDVSARHDREFIGISPEAMEILKRHPWPGNVRELQNLVESMVVLAPGRVILPSDIPTDMLSGQTGSALLPVSVAPVGVEQTGGAGDPNLRTHLEFIFRTMVDLRMDVEDLRQEFDAYREEHTGTVGTSAGVGTASMSEIRGAEWATAADAHRIETVPNDEWPPSRDESVPLAVEVGPPCPEPPEEGTVVFRAGMTMDDMEREAIVAALAEAGGNRRRAAERLQIGERTLYRKLKKFGVD